MQARDRWLGMDRPIARRDFLNGVAVAASAAAGAMLPGIGMESDACAATTSPYPPRLTGLRGSDPGSFETAHRLRDGDLAGQLAQYLAHHEAPSADETYDLVIVGAGISGLAAAWFYREQRPQARILILDNHDDFGGHARRNELEIAGRIHLMNGGTQEIDSPRPYSLFASALLRRLGVEPAKLDAACTKADFYASIGLGRGVFFDRETFGADRLVAGVDARPWTELLADAPLAPAVRADIARLYEAKTDYMPGLTSAQKKDRLARMSYRDFLVKVAGADPGVVPFFQAKTHGWWGVGIDAVSALDVWAFEFPGFQGLDLAAGAAPHMGFTASGYAATGGSEKFHFPDGNASIARLLVRSLVPAVIPGRSAEDIVMAPADYGGLDRPGARVAIRLGSTAVHVRNAGEAGTARAAEVVYVRDGRLAAARGKAVVLACWNMVIPHLVPELPERQKEALRSLVKVPLVYTSVALRQWRAFNALGVHDIYAPGAYHSEIRLNETVDIGGYASVRSPDEPILVHMMRAPCSPGLDEREQHRAGRAELLVTDFETFERNIRDQLARTLGPGGFDPAADITAITVNRWPHGYAYEYNPLFDPDWSEHEQPHVIGRTPFGRIAIANADAGAGAYTDSAIDQAWRAIGEVMMMDE
jgi:spermidine dehydrogenase